MSKLIKTLIVTLTVTALFFGSCAAADAHVTVSSSSTAPGAWATLTFKVPTESPTASTTGLSVDLPKDTPFTSVLTQPVAGWTVQTQSGPLPTPLKDDDGNAITSAITKVIWTATGEGIKPGEFGTFALSVGALPKSGTLFLPAVQHYSDGTDVSWVQQAQGGSEPEHPAPSVVIGTGNGSGAIPPASNRSSDGWGVGLGITGIVLALLAGGGAGAALTRGRRRRPDGAPDHRNVDLVSTRS